MPAKEVRYVGFWRRSIAALIDGAFFQLIAFLVCLALFGQGYVDYISSALAAASGAVQTGGTAGAMIALEGTSYSGLEQAIYFWLPIAATLAFWLSRASSPGLMGIPAQIVEIRTGQKPSTLRMVIRLIAAFVLQLTFGLDYLWILFTREKRALHDLIAGTGVVVTDDPVRGAEWHKPGPRRLAAFGGIAAAALGLHFGLSALLYHENAPDVPLFGGILARSILHYNPASAVLVALAFVILLGGVALPALGYRFSLRWIDWAWLCGSACLVGGGLSNLFERMINNGQGGRNIFWAAESARWVCVTCGLQFPEYYFNPGDFFVSLGMYLLAVALVASRAWLIWQAYRPRRA